MIISTGRWRWLSGAIAIGLALGIAALVVASSDDDSRFASGDSGSVIGNSTVSRASPPAVSLQPYRPDYTIEPGEIVDFDRLPAIDTSTWKAVRGLADVVSIRVPTDWETRLTTQQFEQGVQGDSLALFEPVDGAVDAGVVLPGWVKVDLATHPFVVPVGLGEAPVHTLDLPQTASGVSIRVHQFGQSAQFPDSRGSIMLVPAAGSSPQILGGAAYVALPATASDIAVALAILESIQLR